MVADILRLSEKFEIMGMIDDVNSDRHGTEFGGVPILGGCEQFDKLRREGTTHLIVAIGDCSARRRLAQRADDGGFILVKAIHPSAVIAGDVSIAGGTVIAAGAIVNPGARIGRNCIINTSAIVDHECVIGEAVHIGPGAQLGGRTVVGSGAWIGIGATIIDRVSIGQDSIVGAGAVITRDVPARMVVYGVPGKIIRGVDEPKK